ncbi:MAG: hypothetical protein HY713_12115 [candidate division NC10 bacterium]|nr:hypothetical protein [candidate division NC10 bacterium]
MKRLITLVAIVGVLAVSVSPAFAAMDPPKVPPKGQEGPGIRAKVPPKGLEGPDIRRSSALPSQGIEGPDVR